MATFIAVASAEHVRRGVAHGFMQVNHGAAAPLRRIHPGDHVACYSPTEVYGDKRPLQAFTALGVVADGELHQADVTPDFRPWRRPVRWLTTREARIAPLLDQLEFTKGRRNWAAPLRFGLLKISDNDLAVIASDMALA